MATDEYEAALFAPGGLGATTARMRADAGGGGVIESRDGRRVAITGLGIVAPCGLGVDDFWDGLMHEPKPATVRRITDWDPTAHGLTVQEARRLDRHAQLALGAAAEAVADAGLTEGVRDPIRSAVVLGAGIGGAETWEEQVRVLRERGPRRVSPLTVPMVMPNAASAAVSMRWGWRGPCETIATACASGTHAIAAGAKLVASGRVDRALAGGAESCQTETMVAAFSSMRALSPSGISRPFDVARDGFCASEAGAVLVLEELSAARARGAHVYAEVAGSASTADAHHVTAPAPGGIGAADCMRLALEDARVAVRELTHINAHGTSTPLNDATEALAIRQVFTGHRPAVTSVKGVTGHSLGAAGAVEAVALSLTFDRRLIPPTVGVSQLDEDIDLDVVLEPRDWEPTPALSNSFAFGGHNGCLVFRPV